MEFCFDTMVHSDLGNNNSDWGHIKCLWGLHLACRLQVPYPWSERDDVGWYERSVCFTAEYMSAIYVAMVLQV